MLPLDPPSRLLMISDPISGPLTLRLLDTQTFTEIDSVKLNFGLDVASNLD